MTLPSAATFTLNGAGTLTKTGNGRFTMNTSSNSFTGKYIVKVIVPDGYVYAEKATMLAHAQQLVAWFRAKTPYAEHGPFLNYILVSSIDKYVGRIEKAGGKILLGKQEVPGMGWLAWFEDPAGTKSALWEPNPKRGTP